MQLNVIIVKGEAETRICDKKSYYFSKYITFDMEYGDEPLYGR